MLCDGCEGVGVGKSEGGEGGRLEATDEAELTETSGGGPGTCERVCVCVCAHECLCVYKTYIYLGNRSVLLFMWWVWFSSISECGLWWV